MYYLKWNSEIFSDLWKRLNDDQRTVLPMTWETVGSSGRRRSELSGLAPQVAYSSRRNPIKQQIIQWINSPPGDPEWGMRYFIWCKLFHLHNNSFEYLESYLQLVPGKIFALSMNSCPYLWAYYGLVICWLMYVEKLLKFDNWHVNLQERMLVLPII